MSTVCKGCCGYILTRGGVLFLSRRRRRSFFPQRAEIFALAIALRLFSGNVTVYSDCATVVKGYELLQNNGFELSVLKGWDNLDAWESVCKAETRRLGTATVLKVAAHGR